VPIEVIHDRVPGRLRFSAPGLYRSRVIKQRVEQVLSSLEPIHTVSVNELTARVLIQYQASLAPARICELIDEALLGILPQGLKPSAKKRARQARPRPTAGGKKVHHSAKRHPPHEYVPWHTLALKEVIDRLVVDPELGLSMQEALARLERYGPNQFGSQQIRSDLTIFIEQFKSLPVAMLAISAGIAIATGGRVDAAVILSVVMLNAAIGYATERQAERTIASLGSMAPTHATAIRDGVATEVIVSEIVPGEVIRLSPGVQIPGDARLSAAHRLTVDESALTGESLPVSKSAEVSPAIDTPLSNRTNMLYMGTVVTGGNGRALVVQTGSQTELGQIQSMVDTTRPPETPMEKQLGRMSTQLGILSAAVCAGIFGIGLIRGQPRLQMLNSAVSLAVAAVPEGLPAVATTTLAIGIKDMKRRRVAVRKVEAVETLGSVQVLCLDKTGTLTRNHMTVVTVETLQEAYRIEEGQFLMDSGPVDLKAKPELQHLLQMIALCNEASLENGNGNGSSTEVALLELAIAMGLDIDGLRGAYQTLEVRERAEGRPLMSSIHEDGDRLLLAVKGRPNETLERCSEKMVAGQAVPLSDNDRQAILDANERMAGQALRVLGVAYRRMGKRSKRSARKLVWLGLVGMQDPLRPGMPELIKQYHQAGIKTVMITGDQSGTAYAIGKQLGLANGKALEILDSTQLDKMDPSLLAGLVRRVDVFARVSPAHKLRIVQALQEAGTVVAMTGDGINDGPALKAADIGVAMGESGTDIARSVADVVIEDDNLQTMAVAVRQGRTIYANIRKTIHYLLSTNFSEIEVMLVGITTGLGPPLNPMQLLWINLVTDIFPGLALSFEAATDDVMERPPRPSDTPIITRERLGVMAIESAFITTGAMAAFLFGRATGGQLRGSTLAFHTLTMAQLLHAIASRSTHHSIFDRPRLPRNKWLERALIGTAASQLATMFVPPLRRLMGTSMIGPLDLLVIATGAGLPLLANEAFKELRQLSNTRTHSEDEKQQLGNHTNDDG